MMPVDQADIRLYTGDQRQGKSTAAVASAIDDSCTHMTAIESSDGVVIKAKPLSAQDKPLLEKLGRRFNIIKYAHIISGDGEQSKLIEIPPSYKRHSSVKIFANFSIYGFPYARIGLPDIIANMNTALFNDSWILLDDPGTTNSRRSMEGLGKLGAEFYMSIGKRHAHLCVMSQYTRAIEVWLRLAQTTIYACSYDKKSHFITVDVTKRGEDRYTAEFWAPTYWPFFDSDEIVETPQERIDGALAKFYKQKVLA